MNNLLDDKTISVILTLVIAAAGGAVFSRLKIPAGFMLGAMFFVMAANMIFDKLTVPQFLITASRILAGTLIGSKISKSSFAGLNKMMIPMIFAIVLTLVLSIVSGFLILSVSDIKRAEAFFGTAPGGISDMSLISEEFGADMSRVALLQLVRVIVCIAVIPVFVRQMCKRRPWMLLRNADPKIAVCDDKVKTDKNIKKQDKSGLIRLLATATAGFAGGMLGHISGIPAGALTGAVVFVGALKVKGVELRVPPEAAIIAQVVIGSVIGVSMNRQSVKELGAVIVPAAIIGLSMILIGLLLGIIIHKVWKIDIDTALLSTSPGGMTEMSLMAADLGADASAVAAVHLFRVLAVIIMYPLLLKLLIL